MSHHPDPAKADAIRAAVAALAAKLDIEATRDPWTQWLAQVPRWPSTEADSWLETDVEELIAHYWLPERADFNQWGEMEPFAAYVAVMFMLVRAEANAGKRRAA